MSTSDSDSDVSSRAPPTEAEPPIALSLMSRRLQTFGSPDLEVVVGKEEHVVRYHSLILASQSLYVDTLLSSPAARKEQGKRRITFPDIKRATWEKMIDFLSPNVTNPTHDELMEIIPFYDKYQFHDGLRYCDFVISKRIPTPIDYMGLESFERNYQELPQLLSLIWPLNFFPLSKPLAVKYASRCLRTFHCVDEEMIRLLMPLVINDDKVIKSMVSTSLGRKCRGMTLNEMRDMIDLPDFPEKCISQCRLIEDIDEQRRRLHVAEFYIDTIIPREEVVVGRYKFKKSSEFRAEYGSEFAVSHAGGAMMGYWQKTDNRVGFETRGIVFLESLDVFGSAWEISLQPNASNSDGTYIEQEKRVLFRWEHEVSTSLIPPKRGWKVIDDNGDAIATTKFEITYSKLRDDGLKEC